MSSDAKPGDGDSLTSMQIKVMAIACAFAIATLYYNQPLLALIGATFGTSDSVTSQIVTLSQIGYSLGLFLFVPLGDRVDPRRLILCLLAANTIGLAACALAPNFTLFAVATLVAGLTTISPQIIIPTVAGLAAPQTRGRHPAEWDVGGSAARPDAQRFRRRVRGMARRVCACDPPQFSA